MPIFVSHLRRSKWLITLTQASRPGLRARKPRASAPFRGSPMEDLLRKPAPGSNMGNQDIWISWFAKLFMRQLSYRHRYRFRICGTGTPACAWWNREDAGTI